MSRADHAPHAPRPVPLEDPDANGIHQVLDREGRITEGAKPGLDLETVRELYRTMVLLRAIDERGWTLQRSGRIAFWIPMRGQEAVQVGATQAMAPADWIFRAHRETAPWLMRGGSLEDLFAQFFGAESEPQKGRRLPCLMSSRRLNLIQGTTAVGTFIPHAAGVAWAARMKGETHRVLCIFGDGATSRGEFHSAMNFAGIHRPPIVFLCVNNAWAVSTPLDCQTAQQDFAPKGDAYGVRNLRVDGNDPLAVHDAVREALEVLGDQGPTLIEAVTYRQGFHTSSDNPDLYRMQAEAEAWAPWDPLRRTRLYLEQAGGWSDTDQTDLEADCQARIQGAVEAAEALPLPDAASQFEDVFETSNWMLEEQRQRVLKELESDP